MTPFDVIKNKLHEGMVQGEMHACLRDVGRLAGGYAAGGNLSIMDLVDLANLAESLSKNPREGRTKWEESVAFGRNEPIAWEPQNRGRALEWDDTIGGREDLQIVSPAWVEDVDIEEPDDAAWQPVSDLTRYLSVLYDSEDHVGYVTEAWFNEEAERYLPKRGCYDRTAGQLIQKLGEASGDIGEVFGDYNKDVGAWIRFNALDGAGVKDANVTNYRFALVECDNIPIPRQYALLKELELPIAALVHSGGKSLHAIVRVEATDYGEYRDRVDYLYDVCRKNGLTMDKQNRNPSRLSRMPGVTRKGRKQWLVATAIGKASWTEWREWIEDINDELPEIELVVADGDEPILAPELIRGVLREGHKLLISGPSKAGKSFSLIQLAIAFAEGSEWFGWQVTQGRCLYVNLELDARSAKHRFWAIYKELGISPSKGQIDVWNLRGNACSLNALTPKLIRRAQKKGYKAVIIDPIYKVLTGDENSAAEMAEFCNWFDKICLGLGAATIYCHHHSKGAQGQKSSKDRSSGSGVFARDPDAIIDLIELIIDEPRRAQMRNRWECEAMQAILNTERPRWFDDCSQDDALHADKLMDWAGLVPGLRDARAKARKQANESSAWRLETTLREFPPTGKNSAYFRYPIHVPDRDGILKDAKAEGEESPQEVFIKKREDVNRQRKEEAKERINNAVEACRTEDGVRLKDVAEYLNEDKDLEDEKTMKNAMESTRRTLKKTGGYRIENGFVFKGKKEAV